ncbi:MAG TPA: SMR family transporter [Acidimicrobiales bacterium]
MAWLLLVVAGLLEVAWAVALKVSEGLSRPVPAVVAVSAATASFVLLSTALRSLPVGTGYAVWVGIGAFGVGLVGMLVFGESASPVRLGLLALTLAAVVGLSLVEGRPGA